MNVLLVEPNQLRSDMMRLIFATGKGFPRKPKLTHTNSSKAAMQLLDAHAAHFNLVIIDDCDEADGKRSRDLVGVAKSRFDHPIKYLLIAPQAVDIDGDGQPDAILIRKCHYVSEEKLISAISDLFA